MYTLENIPPQHKEIIQQELNKIPTYNKLLRKAKKESDRGYTKMVERINLQLFDIEHRVYINYLESLHKERVTMKELMETMPASDVADINNALYAIAFCIDIIESNVMEMNEKLSHTQYKYEIDQFNEIIKLGKVATNMRRYMQETASLNPGEEELYADTIESVETQVKNRVKTYLKRSYLLKEKNAKKLTQRNTKQHV